VITWLVKGKIPIFEKKKLCTLPPTFLGQVLNSFTKFELA